MNKSINLITAITGHRDLDGDRAEMVHELQYAVDNLYELYNVNTYLIGMAQGADLLAAETLLNYRKNRNIKIIPVLPCLPAKQIELWNNNDKELYLAILDRIEKPIIYKEIYTKTGPLRRNDIMLSLCHIVIAIYDGRKTGGTAYTVRHAIEQNKAVYRIDPKNNHTHWIHLSPLTNKSIYLT